MLSNKFQLMEASKEIPSTVPRCLFFERYLVQISKDLNICMTRISIFKNVFPQPLHKQSLLAYVTESQYPTGIICFPGRTLEGARNATSVLSTLIEATGMTRTEKGNVWTEMGTCHADCIQWSWENLKLAIPFLVLSHLSVELLRA